MEGNASDHKITITVVSYRSPIRSATAGLTVRIPKGLMAWHNLVGLAADTRLVHHGTTGGGAEPMVAALCTPVLPTRQQLVTSSTTTRRLLVTCQVCVLHLLERQASGSAIARDIHR